MQVQNLVQAEGETAAGYGVGKLPVVVINDQDLVLRLVRLVDQLDPYGHQFSPPQDIIARRLPRYEEIRFQTGVR